MLENSQEPEEPFSNSENATPTRDLASIFWKQFESEYKSESACVKMLYFLCNGHEIRCRHCKQQRLTHLQNSRIIFCHDCKRNTYTLAGTFFHNIRKAKPWLAALWFMEKGVEVSSSGFAKLATIASSSAQEMFKKYTFEILAKMEDSPLMPSTEFISIFIRRSRFSLPGEHARVCRSELQQNQECTDSSAQADGKDTLEYQQPNSKNNDEVVLTEEQTNTEQNLDLIQELLYELMPPGESVHFDILLEKTGIEAGILNAALLMLELDGLISNQGGDRYLKPKPLHIQSSAFQLNTGELERLKSDFTTFVSRTFQGISRKYLQNYLAWYWCYKDKQFWKPGQLFQACATFNGTTYNEIIQYESPPIVKVWVTSAA